MNAPGEYVADRATTVDALRSDLSKVLRLRAEARGRRLAFYDTFDWRLFAAGWLLEV